jgi:hypothetical protein
MTTIKQPFVRIALRQEGAYWHCYFAPMDTLEEAPLIATLHIRHAEDPVRKQQFIELMQGCLRDFIRARRPELGDDFELEWDTLDADEGTKAKS